MARDTGKPQDPGGPEKPGEPNKQDEGITPVQRLVAPFVRRYRAYQPPPTVALSPAPHPYWRALRLIAVTLLGAWLGLLVVGGVGAPVGPVDTKMALRPSFDGGTKVNVSPLGALELDSHHAPIRLDVDLDQLDQERAAALVDQPELIQGLEQEITTDVRAGTVDVAVRAVVAVIVGAGTLGLVVYRRPRPALAASGLALALLAACGTTAYATWNPKSVLEPKFSGLLASAPSVVGDARSIVSDFDVYQQELARLVTNVSKLYETASSLPAYEPGEGTKRVLHVSDIHLNPAAWQIIKSLVKQYDIDVIIDTGDTMDHGTTAENGFLTPMRELGAPYVWVRGNHDSDDTQKAVEQLGKQTEQERKEKGKQASGQPVHVLDSGVPVDVGGLRIAGWGDPQFTPDRSVVPAGDPAEEKAGRNLAVALRAQKAAGTPVDIAVGHNPVLAAQADGKVPLALAGHTHQRSATVLRGGTRLMVEGTTGGGGLRAVEDEEPQKVAASVLYLDRKTNRLQAWDEITLGGLGLSTAEVSRHLPENVRPGSSPSPSPSPSGSGFVDTPDAEDAGDAGDAGDTGEAEDGPEDGAEPDAGAEGDPGTNPATEPGGDPGTTPGADPGTASGADPGTASGAPDEPAPGTSPGPGQ